MRTLAIASCLLALTFAAGSPPENQVNTPGISSCRMAAEWEPVIGSIIAWPLIIPEALVTELAEGNMQLYVMVSDEINRYAADKAFKEWGVNMGNIQFIVTRLGLAWGGPRDWGPFAVFSDSGAYWLADPRFVTYPLAGPDCNKNKAPDPFSKKKYIGDDPGNSSLADSLGFNIVPIAAALTGGNFLVDGGGAGFFACGIPMEN